MTQISDEDDLDRDGRAPQQVSTLHRLWLKEIDAVPAGPGRASLAGDENKRERALPQPTRTDDNSVGGRQLAMTTRLT